MNKKQLSLFQLILSMFIFGTIGIFRRSLPVSSSFLSMYRGFAGSLFLSICRFAGKRKPDWHKVKRKIIPLLITGAMIGMNWILLFESYRYTTVAVSTLCYYMSPVFVMIASPLILRQKLERRKVICVVLSLIGMVLITGVFSASNPGGQNKFTGVLLGLGAAVLYAVVILMNQTLSDVPSLERTILQLFSAGAAVLPYTLLTDGTAGFQAIPQHWTLFLLIGLVHTGIAYILYFSSMDGLSAQTVAVISYLDPFTAILLSALFLHEPMDLPGVVGTVLILSAAIYSEIPFSVHGKRKQGQA